MLLLLPQRGAEEEEVVQPCWSNVHLDSWYFVQSPHFKTIHHARVFTSRPRTAELAPWEVLSCENWLGRTALAHEKNALTSLFFKGKVKGRGWLDSQGVSVHIRLSCALPVGGYGQAWPRCVGLVQMGGGRPHCHVFGVGLHWGVELQSPVVCVSPQQNGSAKKETQALKSELQTLGLSFDYDGML